MIPKKIHYCWFGGKPLPSEVKRCIKSWKKFAPDYEIIQWNESNFDVSKYEFTEAAYKAHSWAFVSDYARLKIIFNHGGIYLDTDVELLKNPDFLLENKFYIGVQQCGKYVTTGLGFGAEKHNDIVKELLGKYDNVIFSEEDKEKLACPLLNMAVFENLGYIYRDEVWKKNGVTIYPCKYFDPCAPGVTANLLCDDTVSIHHYSASWLENGTRLKRKICILLGQHRINKVKSVLKRVK